jgi:hypothetical protein
MKDAKGRTVMHVAAMYQNYDLAKAIFDKVPAEDVHISPDSTGYTAFHLAICRHSEYVYFSTKHATKNTKNNHSTLSIPKYSMDGF